MDKKPKSNGQLTLIIKQLDNIKESVDNRFAEWYKREEKYKKEFEMRGETKHAERTRELKKMLLQQDKELSDKLSHRDEKINDLKKNQGKLWDETKTFVKRTWFFAACGVVAAIMGYMVSQYGSLVGKINDIPDVMTSKIHSVQIELSRDISDVKSDVAEISGTLKQWETAQ